MKIIKAIELVLNNYLFIIIYRFIIILSRVIGFPACPLDTVKLSAVR